MKNNGINTVDKKIKQRKSELPKYLVRPDDFHIFEIDNSNNRYRSYCNKNVKNRPNAYMHFSFENLTNNFGFFPIDENEISIYEEKNHFYHQYLNWATRSDGHGGSKGGTMEEYLEYLKNK